jgi:uncharacterized protein YciI
MSFYLILRHHPAPIDDHALVVEHLAWMRAQHESGTVVISGPSSDGATGIYVMRVSSHEDAAALAATDPLAGDGVRLDIIDWDVHQMLGIGSFEPPSVRPGDVD